MMLASIGVFLSMYLWYIHLSADDVLCFTGGCNAVLTGEFSQIAGVPVAAMGVAFYAFILVLAFQRSKIEHKLLDQMLYGWVGVGLLFTLYLRYLEFAKIGEICEWCWVSVVIVIGLIITLFVEWRRLGRK